MTKPTLADQIRKEEEVLQKANERIAALKDKEAQRILKAADKAGYFSVNISTEDLETAFRDLVQRARSTA